MEKELELLKEKIKVLEKEIEILKMKQPIIINYPPAYPYPASYPNQQFWYQDLSNLIGR